MTGYEEIQAEYAITFYRPFKELFVAANDLFLT